jgi:hypothetical protein
MTMPQGTEAYLCQFQSLFEALHRVDFTILRVLLWFRLGSFINNQVTTLYLLQNLEIEHEEGARDTLRGGQTRARAE